MNNRSKLAVAILAVAGLSGCASTRIAEFARTEVAPAAEQHEVSRPAQSYGSMGGYRYRRLVKVTITSS